MRISDWSSDVCSSDLLVGVAHGAISTSLRATNDAGGYEASEAAVASAIGFDVTNNSYGNVVFGQTPDGFAAVERTATPGRDGLRSEEHKSELQSLTRISTAIICSQKKNNYTNNTN